MILSKRKLVNEIQRKQKIRLLTWSNKDLNQLLNFEEDFENENTKQIH